MFRFSIGLATTVVTLSLLAAPIGDAAAQPEKKGAPAAAAPRAAPAPAPRAAPAPAPQAAPAPMVRSAPAPQISRPAPSAARQAPVVRSAPQQRPADVRPQQSAPRIATPRSTPSIQRQAIQRPTIQRQAIQRQAPSSRAATRVERQQAIQPRQQSVQSKPTTPSTVASGTQSQRVQQLESKRRLSRSERRELSQLRRNERQNAQQIQSNDQQKAALANNNNQQRLQQLESKRRLTRSERNELRQLRRNEQQNARQNLTADQQKTAATTTTNNQQRIQQLQSKGRLSRSERRELRQLQREDRQNASIQQQQQQKPLTSTAAQRQRTPRAQVSAQQVTQGRFASNLSAANAGGGRRAGRRAARLASQIAWQLGVLAPYVPWRGPVYWPYAYNDLFYYTFWPDAYDPGYWAYAYDDFIDGVFFPDGAPFVEYAAEGPYDGAYARSIGTTGAAPPRAYSGAGSAPGRVNQATREFCADQASGVTAWPLDKIADAVRPTAEQRQLLNDLRKASQQAAAEFKDACPESVPLTPPGRLQAMTQRLQATSDAVATVKPALEAFYDSLTDEQKARFNEIGPSLAKRSQRAAAGAGQEPSAANCSSEKAGLTGIAVNRIEDILQPSNTQAAGLDRLADAMQKSVDILRDACPNTLPMTPVGRLEVMKQRLDAMIAAANAVRPALEDFYASLSDEQKAKFNRLGRQTVQSGG